MKQRRHTVENDAAARWPMCAVVWGPERVLFGTDHPFGIADADACIRAIRQAAASETDAAAMLDTNAETLFFKSDV